MIGRDDIDKIEHNQSNIISIDQSSPQSPNRSIENGPKDLDETLNDFLRDPEDVEKEKEKKREEKLLYEKLKEQKRQKKYKAINSFIADQMNS